MEQLDIAVITLRLCLLIILAADKTTAAAVAHRNEDLIGGQGLYNASDNVVILNATNFKANVYGSSRGWLVEFYNSWCGFCFRFAPIWKALSSDILSWNDIVVVAAIDCANDDNNPICREYEIMHYPMLKYFSMDARPPSLGIEIEKIDGTDGVRHNLIKTLEKEQQEGRGSTWPNLAPYRNIEITDIWKTASSNVKHFFLIFENTDSHLGKEVILDLHRISSLQIRRVTSDNEPLCVTNKVTKFPTLIAFSRNESQRIINVRIATREGVRRAIRDYMIARGFNMDEVGTTVLPNSQQHENAHQTTTTATINKSTIRKKTDDHLYQLDLENALRYSIKHEIPLKKTIEGERMEALQRYLTVLAAYFPLRRSNMYLEVIRDVIDSKRYVTGEVFSHLTKATEEEMSPVYSKPYGWIGCKGSANLYRGYPCGLWTMFHMLTVNFAQENKDNSWAASLRDDPAAVLRAMNGYVRHFFGCADCAAHFAEMVSKYGMFNVRTRDEAVLWLWRAHNQVNARLSGDNTEDPEHKKMQYPTVEHCMACRYANDTWNEGEVLRYLKAKYSYSGIKYDGITNNDGADGTVNGNKSRTRRPERFVTETKLAASGEDLNGFDISIWLVLYVMSSVIFTLVCSRELKSYRRRMWVQEEGYKKKRNHLNPLVTV